MSQIHAGVPLLHGWCELILHLANAIRHGNTSQQNYFAVIQYDPHLFSWQMASVACSDIKCTEEYLRTPVARRRARNSYFLSRCLSVGKLLGCMLQRSHYRQPTAKVITHLLLRYASHHACGLFMHLWISLLCSCLNTEKK